jgi:acetyl esterase/lipase
VKSRGLPPLLIRAGSYELLLDDPIRLAARAAADDVVVTLGVTPEVPHLSQAFAPMLRAAGRRRVWRAPTGDHRLRHQVPSPLWLPVPPGYLMRGTAHLE